MSLVERTDSFCLTVLGVRMSVYDLLTQLFQIYSEHCGNVGDAQIISYRMKWRSWSPTVLLKGVLPIVNIQTHLAKGPFKRQIRPTPDLSLPTEASGSQPLSPPPLSESVFISLPSLPFPLPSQYPLLNKTPHSSYPCMVYSVTCRGHTTHNGTFQDPTSWHQWPQSLPQGLTSVRVYLCLTLRIKILTHGPSGDLIPYKLVWNMTGGGELDMALMRE